MSSRTVLGLVRVAYLHGKLPNAARSLIHQRPEVLWVVDPPSLRSAEPVARFFIHPSLVINAPGRQQGIGLQGAVISLFAAVIDVRRGTVGNSGPHLELMKILAVTHARQRIGVHSICHPDISNPITVAILQRQYTPPE